MAAGYNGKPRTWRTSRVNSLHHTQLKDVRDFEAVQSFNGQYKWLSNFFWCDVELDGLIYPSVEHAFQAAKLVTNADRRSWGFLESTLSFGEAKRLGRRVQLREDWKDIREAVMTTCLRSKFAHAHLRAKLLATGQKELIDGHSGSPDLVWGYHFPSQAGENRLGKLLMALRSEFQGEPKAAVVSGAGCESSASFEVALYHLDWPMKCLHDGLPQAYAKRIGEFARLADLGGRLVVLPRRKICIALRGLSSNIDAWEHRMRTEDVDVNSRGRPCKERMMVKLLRCSAEGSLDISEFDSAEVSDWCALCKMIARSLALREAQVHSALGPEPPELPRKVVYQDNRAAVLLDGKRFDLCLNDHDAEQVQDALLGNNDSQCARGAGIEIPLMRTGKHPSIFGGKFARRLDGVLDEDECRLLIDLAEKTGFGLAGSRGFNPFARFALRCLVDAPHVASAITARLSALLPGEYPPNSGRPLVGVNQRLRFLKYTPGMHHSGDHTDCAHEDPVHGRSFLTVQLYLNSNFSGGRTTFVSDRLIPVEPTPGGVVVFDHELYHRGGQVTEGTKYAVRMDVLYGHAGKPISLYESEHSRAQISERSMPTASRVEPAAAAVPKRKGRWVRSGQES
eukprot:TRINITY_DN25891_c0_g1_i1.p1 TRINITY_DN25891_c0_g1~~TRINITY_DN25891_c0_g1_i1.p1  ORF type:complete len:644 (-),score=40.25 TRINITY_DN25891_c0_g1_i1:408-2276(-)